MKSLATLSLGILLSISLYHENNVFAQDEYSSPGSKYLWFSSAGYDYRLFGYEMGQTVYYPIDVGVVAIVAPVSGQNLTSTETVMVIVKNFGFTAVSNIPVRFSVNGVNSNVEYIPMTLPAQAQITYTFVQTADLHWYNNYQFCATTLLNGDLNPSNDEKCLAITHSQATITDTIFPLNAAMWTGTVSGPATNPASAIMSTSYINYSSNAATAGWAMFPLTTIPAGQIITDVQLNWWLQSQNGNPYLSLRRVLADPLTASPSALYTSIKTGYAYTQQTNNFNAQNTWHQSHLQDFGDQVLTDIQIAAMDTNQIWTVGFYDAESCDSCYTASIHGWNELNKPYLLLSYLQSLAHDVGVDTLLIDPILIAGSTLFPAAKVRNYGTTGENFSVTMTGPGGYTSTRSLYRGPSQDTILVFDVLSLPQGNVCFTATAHLATDINLTNQTKGKCIITDSVLTRAYGFVNNPLNSGLQPGPVWFYLEHPEILFQITPNSSLPPLTSGAFGKIGTTDTWFVAEPPNPPASQNGNLLKIDINSGAVTTIGQLGVNIDGMTYNYFLGKLFGINSVPSGCCNYQTSIYEIKTHTGQATLYANLGLTSGKIDNLACNAAGMMFFTDTKSDEFYAFYPSSFSKEKLGPLGTDLNYVADMEFDREKSQLYLSGNNLSTGAGGLYKIDAASGQSSLVNTFQGGVSLSGLAIPYTPIVSATDAGIMWITVPTTGNMSTNESVCVKLVNDGTLPISNFNISYQIDNGPVQTIPFGSIALDTSDLIDYCFFNPETFAAGTTYCIKAWTSSLPLDMNNLNDTAKKCVTNTACSYANLCYPNATQEAEFCGDNQNAGCGMTPPAFENMNPGSAFCGDVWKVDTFIDKDSYQFSTTLVSNVYFSVRTEFDLDMHLLSLPCGNSTVLASQTATKCGEDSLVYENLPPGTYALVISPKLSSPDLICGISNRYSLKFNTIPSQAGIHTSIGTLNGPCPGLQEVPIFIDSCYLVNQFHLNITLPPDVTFMGYNNLNPAFDASSFAATQNGNILTMNWFSTSQVSPGSGLLIKLVLNLPSGTSNLIWTSGTDSSFYANASQGFLPATFAGATLNVGICNDLSGTVLYAHKSPVGIYLPYPIGNPAFNNDSVKVTLAQGNTILYTAYPDSNGNYSFTNLANGSYTLTAVVTKKWGGVNMIDALLIMQNFVGNITPLLASPWVDAGDVNGEIPPALPNSLDALLIARRFVGLIPNFLPPQVVPGKSDWHSESFNISINGMLNQTKDIRVLCSGDINGSY